MRPPFEKFKGGICRGCYSLGTACGKCERCEWEQNLQALQSKPDTPLTIDSFLADVQAERIGRLVAAINWAMGCGADPADEWGAEHKHPYWWRRRLAEMAGLEYSPEECKYVLQGRTL